MQSGDKSRVWGVNLFAALPTFKGKFRADVARQCGGRMSTFSDYEKGTNSWALLVAPDPDAPATVPGVAPDGDTGKGESIRPLVQEDAALLGNVLVSRYRDCSSDPAATEELVKNARNYAERYELEAGFRRCASCMSVPNARASFFEVDAPPRQAYPEWLAYWAAQELRFPGDQQAQPYRFAECAPTPHSLRGSLEDEGSAYQCAACAAALVFLLAPAMVAPAAIYSNCVMLTEVILLLVS